MYPENFCEARARHEHIDFGETASFSFPRTVHQIFNKRQRNIVQHQCEQRLVRSPFRFTDRRKETINSSCHDRSKHHEQHQRKLRKDMSCKKSESAGCYRPHKDLPLAADIPEFHLKCKGDANRRDQQRHCNLDRLMDHRARSPCPFYHRDINRKRIMPQHKDHDSSGHKRQDKRYGADPPGFILRHRISLYHPYKRFFCLCAM